MYECGFFFLTNVVFIDTTSSDDQDIVAYIIQFCSIVFVGSV